MRTLDVAEKSEDRNIDGSKRYNPNKSGLLEKFVETIMQRRDNRVDDYLVGLAPERKAALVKIRDLVFKTVPDAQESMRYKMPTYAYAGEGLCAFASQKHYMSLYMDVEILAKHKDELNHLNLGKSCIRFTKLEKLPLETVKQILRETIVRA